MKIILSGYGKIGKLLGEQLLNHELLILDPKYSNIGIENIYDDYDVIIDFSCHSSIYGIKSYLDKHRKTKIIIGTTSYNEEENKIINSLAESHVVIKDSNYSYSMLIFKNIINCLNELDLKEFNLLLKETHHISKYDKPSGTSKDLIKCLSNYKVNIEVIRNNTRKGGIHEFILSDKNGKIIIKHEASNKTMFVEGVLKCLDNIFVLENGLYSFEDIVYGNK